MMLKPVELGSHVKGSHVASQFICLDLGNAVMSLALHYADGGAYGITLPRK